MARGGSNIKTSAKAAAKTRTKPGAPQRGQNRGSTFVTAAVILVTALAMSARQRRKR